MNGNIGKNDLTALFLYYKVFEADDGKTGLDVVGRNIEVAETMKQIDAASRSGATHEGSPAGELTRVLSPDDVMGDTVWAEEVRQATNRASEKPNVRKGINRRCSAWCFLMANLLFE